MAQAVITKKNPVKTILVEDKISTNISIDQKQYSKIVKIDDIIPFYLRFTNIGVPGYSSTNFPGIGLQIIGYSNYIL